MTRAAAIAMSLIMLSSLLYILGKYGNAAEVRFQSSDSEAISRQAWTLFKSQYEKTYFNAEEEFRRAKIFNENLKTIEKHNTLYDMGLSTYKMGINRFSDMEFSEFLKPMTGFRGFDVNFTETFTSQSDLLALSEIDWRSQGYVTPVKDQGQCGSCWAFSSTGSLEGQIKRKTGRLISLSEQNLVDCSTAWGNSGCNGGSMQQAFMYIKENGGIDTAEYYPYEAKDGPCRYKSDYSGGTVSGFANVKSRDENALKDAISTVGPISVAIQVLESFRHYKSGIYEDPDCNWHRLNHAVLAVGYGSEADQDFYIVKNSWGKSWGENGYIRMARNKDNMCGIASVPVYPLV